jgi:hypothetical protein
MSGQDALGSCAVGEVTGVEQAIDRCRRVLRAVVREQRGDIATARGGGDAQWPAPVGSRGFRISAVDEQQLDECRAGEGAQRRGDGGGAIAVVVAVAVGIGARLEQQAHDPVVVGADRGGQGLLGDRAYVERVLEQQRKSADRLGGERREVEVVVGDRRTALEQQPQDGFVAGAGGSARDRASQRRPALSVARDDVAKAQCACGIDVPARAARGVQRGPTASRVAPRCGTRVCGEIGLHARDVAEDDRGREVVSG